jgi:OOP family OmpA-OmpF porin
MTKLNKVTVLLASVAFAGAVFAAPSTTSSDNWRNGHGNLQWKDTSGDCWRNSVWTPATAAEGCGKPAAAAAAPAAVPAVEAKPVVAAEKITLQADAYFDFDKSTLKAEGKAKLDELAGKLGQVNVETIVATGHTDSIGTDAYNNALSLRRANAVKAYLVSKGVAADRVLVEGKGEAKPVASNATKAGRAQNRRVVVEVVGVKK